MCTDIATLYELKLLLGDRNYVIIPYFFEEGILYVKMDTKEIISKYAELNYPIITLKNMPNWTLVNKKVLRRGPNYTNISMKGHKRGLNYNSHHIEDFISFLKGGEKIWGT